MFNISKNGVGISVLIVSLLALIGVNIEVESIDQLIAAIGTVASIIMLIINQLKRPDTTGFWFKKW